MPITLATHATKLSTFAFIIAFFDEESSAVVPNSITWSLLTPAGDVVNGKAAVVETPAATVTIVLGGLDLDVTDILTNCRKVYISAPYDSDLGSGLPFAEELTVVIDDTVGG